jgi:cold shock CspA family protein
VLSYKGKVKFYSANKGYGFIFREGSGDLYFHITDVLGADPPDVGDEGHKATHPGPRTKCRAPCTSGSVLRASSIWIGLIGYACL